MMSGNSIESQRPQTQLRLQNRVSFRYPRLPHAHLWMPRRRELPARKKSAVNRRRAVTCLNRSSARRSNESAQRGSSSHSAKKPFQVKPFRVNVSQFFKEIRPIHNKTFREPDCSDWLHERFRVAAGLQKNFGRQASRTLLRLRLHSLLAAWKALSLLRISDCFYTRKWHVTALASRIWSNETRPAFRHHHHRRTRLERV